MRLNLPARKISAEQGGWQRVLCVLCTSIRRVKGFFFFFCHFTEQALGKYRYVRHYNPC